MLQTSPCPIETKIRAIFCNSIAPTNIPTGQNILNTREPLLHNPPVPPRLHPLAAATMHANHPLLLTLLLLLPLTLAHPAHSEPRVFSPSPATANTTLAHPHTAADTKAAARGHKVPPKEQPHETIEAKPTTIQRKPHTDYFRRGTGTYRDNARPIPRQDQWRQDLATEYGVGPRRKTNQDAVLSGWEAAGEAKKNPATTSTSSKPRAPRYREGKERQDAHSRVRGEQAQRRMEEQQDQVEQRENAAAAAALAQGSRRKVAIPHPEDEDEIDEKDEFAAAENPEMVSITVDRKYLEPHHHYEQIPEIEEEEQIMPELPYDAEVAELRPSHAPALLSHQRPSDINLRLKPARSYTEAPSEGVPAAVADEKTNVSSAKQAQCVRSLTAVNKPGCLERPTVELGFGKPFLVVSKPPAYEYRVQQGIQV